MSAESLIFSVLGRGIGYSASPAMMAAAFSALDVPHRYVIAEVAPEDLADTLDALRDDGVGGANVTTPHKGDAARLVDECSAEAERAGAVNTIAKHGRRLVGHNTDLPALLEAVARLRPAGAGRAIVLGAGGAARTVALALETAHAADITLLSRSDGTWARMAERLATADLLVNATPIGTQSEDSPVPADLLRPDLAVLDLVYRPTPTRLVREARAAGATAEAGAGVLLGQGRRSLELWLGVPAPLDAMAAALRGELGAAADV